MLDKRSVPPTGESYPPSARLKRKRNFAIVQSKGKRLHSRHLVVLVMRTLPNLSPRLGITISNKVEKRAAERNRFKRRIRDIFRRHRPLIQRSLIQNSWDIVVIARKNALDASFLELKTELLGLLEKEKII